MTDITASFDLSLLLLGDYVTINDYMCVCSCRQGAKLMWVTSSGIAEKFMTL